MLFGDANGHVSRNIDGFCGVHGGCGVGEINLERRMLLVLPVKDIVNVNGLVERKREMSLSHKKKETEINIVLVEAEMQRKLTRTISLEFQHMLSVAGVGENRMRIVEAKKYIDGKKACLLKGRSIRKRFQEQVIHLIETASR